MVRLTLGLLLCLLAACGAASLQEELSSLGYERREVPDVPIEVWEFPGESLQVQPSVTLFNRDGRWEVVGIDFSPTNSYDVFYCLYKNLDIRTAIERTKQIFAKVESKEIVPRPNPAGSTANFMVQVDTITCHMGRGG